ncbi:MAG: metallophosphoesterase [archaeon]
MKVLVIGDPHGKLPTGLDNLVKKNKIELIICLGDVPYTPEKPWEKERWTDKVMRKSIKSYGFLVNKLCSHKIPVFTLRGNMFWGKEGKYNYNKITKKIFKKHKNLYYKKTGRLKYKGNNFVFFDMIFEPSSSRTKRKYSKKRLESGRKRGIRLNKILKQTKDAILISHIPPKGYLDKTGGKHIPKEWKGRHAGSPLLLKAIKKHKPKYVLCGHIHEGKGKVKIGKTQVINAGCCGDYVVIGV